MEKGKHPNSEQGQEAKSQLWDCDSCLYDSFELKSFQRQLDSAIASRTFSMPRLSEVAPRLPRSASSRSSKITLSIRKLLRSVFHRRPTSDRLVRVDEVLPNYAINSNTGEVLPKVTENWEKGAETTRIMPEYGSLMRKSASERFMGTAPFIISSDV